jgi:hypothetical protein
MFKSRRFLRTYITLLAAAAFLATVAAHDVSESWAGGPNLNRNSVGGVTVNVEGVVGQLSVDGVEALRKARVEKMARIADGLSGSTAIRRVSLKRLEAEIARILANNISGTPFDLPDAIRYLGGLQRIEYVFVYPEKNDIVLAGPGEGWKIDATGSIVGATTGRPVLLLEDLMVALRYIKSARQTGISCSIDPTAEGRRKLEAFLNAQTQFSRTVAADVEKSMGMQNITVTGVPAESHLARVLVASDYRMKRIGMNLDKSPVPGLPGYLDLLRSTRGLSADVMPRWWLACNYQPLAKADNGLAWQIRGPGVKAMTENDFIDDAGEITNSAGTNPVAQNWANLMTKHYDELSVEDSVFGHLRNVMDMCVVAALIEKERLVERAGVSLPLLTDPDSKLVFHALNPPKQVPSQCSYMKKDRSWIITASGGVDIDAWKIVEQAQIDIEVDKIRQSSTAPQDAAWWWN